MPATRDNPVEAVTRYLDNLFSRVADSFADRLAPRVAQRLEDDYEQMATLDVLRDPDLRADLEAADLEPDEDAVPYEEVRRELGLA